MRRFRLPLLLIGVASAVVAADALLWAWSGVAPAAVSGHHRGDDLDLRVHPGVFSAVVRLLLSAGRSQRLRADESAARATAAAGSRPINERDNQRGGIGIMAPSSIEPQPVRADARTSICTKVSRLAGGARSASLLAGRSTSATIPQRITPPRCGALSVHSGDMVFSTGGIGATPDDVTRVNAPRRRSACRSEPWQPKRQKLVQEYLPTCTWQLRATSSIAELAGDTCIVWNLWGRIA